MAVDQNLLDDIAASVADIYRHLESALNTEIADRLRQDMDSPYQLVKLDAVQKLRRSAQTILGAINNRVAEAVRDGIAAAYRNGHGTAQTELPEGWFPRSGIGQDARQATRDIPNAPSIEVIAQALHRDLGHVSGNVLRNVEDAYRAVQAGAAARIVSGTQTRLQAAQAVWQRLVDKGITSFTDRAGRQWKLSSYAEMITRTNAQRAATLGQTDRLGTIGVKLVIVSNHGQECEVCRPFEGKVLSLSGPTGKVQVEHATRDGHMVTVQVKDTLDGARRAGLMHPNCRHSVSAYLPGVTEQPKNTADPEGDQARQRQRQIERQIRKYKERADAALTDEAKKLANAQTRKWQAEMRDHLKAHPKLKRLPYRERIGAGNIPGPSGPKGGPVGDLGPTVQPTLDDGPGASRTVPRTEQTSPAARPNTGQQDVLDVKPEPKKPEPKKAKPKGPAADFHRNLDGIEDLARDVDDGSPPRERKNLMGGVSADVELVTLKGGKRVVHKSGGDAEAEQMASKIANALGLKAPRVYRDHDSSVWMDYIDDAKTADQIRQHTRSYDPDHWHDWQDRRRDAIGSDDGKVIGLLDHLVANADRNDGNWMLTDDDRIRPIDHGHAFGAVPHSDRIRGQLRGNGPFAEHYSKGVPNDLTPEDVREVRRRLDELAEDFAHVGRPRWLEYAQRVLDVLEKDAKGTRNLIAGVR